MRMATSTNILQSWLQGERSIAPLVIFRFSFGVLMFISMLRFWLNGWIEKLYLEPSFHFSYLGFQSIKPLGDWTYLLFGFAAISALGLAFACFYRISAALFFISFTYIELMDKTTYLNHYYFVSIVAFVLIFIPAHKALSLDAGWSPKNLNLKLSNAYYLGLFGLVSMVYFYAGLAKINSDWLLRAEPLATWLPGKYDLPIIGGLLEQKYLAFFFSWAAMIYDLMVPFLLWFARSRPLALVLVLIFHILTRLLFPIGMFPFIMVLGAFLFIDAGRQERFLRRIFRFNTEANSRVIKVLHPPKLLHYFFICLLAFQLLWPWRYLAYPGELFWHEQGFRFSWRVMLMEKAGYAQFTIKEPETGLQFKVDNRQFLSSFQEKQMSFQPDFILEFAHHLAHHYQGEKGLKNVEVYAEAFVALNGRPSQAFIDPNINLAACERGWAPKKWILPFNDTIYGL